MQLLKSKKSALILATIVVLSFSLTMAIFEILMPYWLNGSANSIVADPERLSQPGSLVGLSVFLIAILLILIFIGAFWLYRFFGERYYGRRGALRWALFGVMFALLMQGFDLIFGENLPVIKGVLQFLSVFGAFFLSRLLLPIGTQSQK